MSKNDKSGSRHQVHFLHIGKNAGTQFKYCAAQVNGFSKTHTFALHPHTVKLADLPEGAAYTFCIRDPLKRFVSGFYSRKRKGQPRIYSEWSEVEELIFGTFEHANDIAENLWVNGELGRKAQTAIRRMRHTGEPQYSWFRDIEGFLEKWPPVHILRQETFNQDLLKLYDLLGIDIEPVFAEGDRSSHKNDYSDIPPLSDLAKENLKRWYHNDHKFIALCNAWRESRGLA